MEEMIQLFSRIGLPPAKCKESANNKKLCPSLAAVIEEVFPTGWSSCSGGGCSGANHGHIHSVDGSSRTTHAPHGLTHHTTNQPLTHHTTPPTSRRVSKKRAATGAKEPCSTSSQRPSPKTPAHRNHSRSTVRTWLSVFVRATSRAVSRCKVRSPADQRRIWAIIF